MRITSLPKLLLALVAGISIIAAVSVAATADSNTLSRAQVRSLLAGPSLDGSGNNIRHPDRGRAGTPYIRLAPAVYRDGIGEPATGPASPRYISNRIYNDLNQNVFTPGRVSHWGMVWGQFIDHTIGKAEGGTEPAPLTFDPTDPLESFQNPTGTMPFTRSAVAPGTGVTTPRQQVNTVSSYLDGAAVYGNSRERLDWLRPGPLDGDPTNNDAHLLLVDGNLPTAAARPGTTAPAMDRFSVQNIDPSTVVIAGDSRANENLALTAVHTLFAREHNRIVDALPSKLGQEVKFQIARRVVMAEIQYITYNEFLPALGVRLPRYRGYDPRVDASVADEFATVGYRAHSQIHGEFETAIPVGSLSAEQVAALTERGVETTVDGQEMQIVVPLNVAFGRPELVPTIGLSNVLLGLAHESNYRNDEMIDNQLRSVLFQSPNTQPDDCLDGPTLPACFGAVLDLGALDLARAYDHGMPLYNQLRAAYGLAPIASFTDITGESTDALPAGSSIDDPSILAFTELRDATGALVTPGTDAAENDVTSATRASTTAARLKAIYQSVDRLDAFTGMMSEQHVAGTEFGPLQLASWSSQFGRLRDGDRFFYQNDATLQTVAARFHLSYKTTLADVISANTGVARTELPRGTVFKVTPSPAEATAPPTMAAVATSPGPPTTQLSDQLSDRPLSSAVTTVEAKPPTTSGR